MKLPAYPQYKPSGVEWLGNVPEHWETLTVRRRAKRIQTGGTPPTAEERYYEDGTVPWFGPGSFDDQIFVSEPIKLLNASAFKEGTARMYSAGATMVVTIGATLGKVSSFNEAGSCNQQITVIEFDKQHIHPRFATYQLKCLEPALRAIAPSATLPILDQGEIADVVIGVPPLSEQAAIAAFLDRETGRVDRLVAKKRELIERLKEKRTALISRTVTRGLPSAAARAAGLPVNPRLKPSGIDWIGDVPEHWGRANKLARLASRRKHSFVNGPFGSDLLTAEITDEGVPVIYIRDISAGHYRRVSEGCVTLAKAKELNFCRVDPGDVLIAKVGDPPGAAAVYPVSEPSGIVTQDVIRIRVDESSVSARYVAYFLNSSAGRGLIDQIAIESTRMRVSLGDYKSSLCVSPPLPEQVAIAAYLDKETAKLDALVAKVEAAAERLQEYRTALITAAVTGKIDVRSRHR